jgi:hypothetical protein
MDGNAVGRVELKRTLLAALIATETFDVDVDLGLAVSLNDFDRRPVAFDGRINSIRVVLKWRAMMFIIRAFTHENTMKRIKK